MGACVNYARVPTIPRTREADARLRANGDLPVGIREGKPFNPFLPSRTCALQAERRNAISVIAASETKWQGCRSDGAFRELFAVSRIAARLLMQFTFYQSLGYWLVRKNNNVVTNISVNEVRIKRECIQVYRKKM